MVSKHDEIIHQLKQEDFFRVLKRWLPLVIAMSLITISGVGVYLWMESRRDHALFLQEQRYAEAVKRLEKNPLEGQNQLKALALENPSFQFLYIWERETASSKLGEDTIQDSSQKRKEEERFSEMLHVIRHEKKELRNFMTLVKAFHNSEKASSVEKSLQEYIKEESSPWHFLATLQELLQHRLDKDFVHHLSKSSLQKNTSDYVKYFMNALYISATSA